MQRQGERGEALADHNFYVEHAEAEDVDDYGQGGGEAGQGRSVAPPHHLSTPMQVD